MAPKAESLLSRVSADDLVWEPFPHVVVRDALDPGLCDALIAECPPLTLLTGRDRWASNQRYSYSARKAWSD